MPSHHLPSDVLVAWTAGTTSPGEELLIACHLTVCPACRAVTEQLDEVAATLAAGVAPVAVDDSALAAVLARLDDPVTAAPEPPPCSVFPRPLVRAIAPFRQVAWSRPVWGVRVARVPVPGAQRAFLMDFPPALRLPRHAHQGIERTFVIRGGFTDERGHYARGDVVWRAEGTHDVRIDADGRCTTLFINDGATELGWFTAWFDWWVGHR